MAIEKETTKTPRVYKRITPKTVAIFKATEALEGNGSAAVRRIESTRLSPKDRAYRITKKSEQVNTVDFIEDQLQQIGVDAINRLGKLVNSGDERVGLKAVQYSIDHIRGQAVRRSESKHVALTIEAVLD